MGRRCRITFLYIPSRNVIIHRLYEIVNILLPAIISEGGVPSEVGKKKNSSENKKMGRKFFHRPDRQEKEKSNQRDCSRVLA